MQVNRTGFQPNFQAKFIKNDIIIERARNEINCGRGEQLTNALNKLSKHHTNVVLELTTGASGDIVTNLYNGNKCYYSMLNTDDIEELSDVKSKNYKQLFAGDKTITPSKIADKYFVDSAPDYTIGHKVDKSL